MWPYQARPEQIAPDFPGHPNFQTGWRFFLALAGRGWGKSRAGAEWVRQKKDNAAMIALVGETAADVRDVMVEGPSGILATAPPWDRPLYEPSKRQLTWNNGAIAKTYSGDDPEQLRGPQHAYAWVDELAKFRYAMECWDQLMFGLRIRPFDNTPPQVFVTTTPKPLPILTKKIIPHKKTVMVVRSMYDNIENLSEEFIDDIKATYEGTSLGQQEIHAAILDEAKGALWRRELIDSTRSDDKPAEFWKTNVIGVDPQTASKRNSTGIIAVSEGADGHGYVRADATADYMPAQWAKAVCELFYQIDGDYVVAEGNQGGEMVRHTIHSYDPKVPVVIVHARQGKQARAEPVSMLYQQGRIHHIGTFANLEEQMVTWEPESGLASPDRLDALVWACRRLFITNKRPRGVGGVPQQVAING